MPIQLDYYQKPAFGTSVNLTKSICANMVGAFMLNEGGGAFMWDTITGRQGTTRNSSGILVTNYNPSWIVSPYGQTISIDGGHELGNWGLFQTFTSPLSVEFLYSPGSVGVAGGIWNCGTNGAYIRLNTSSKMDFLKATAVDMGQSTTSWNANKFQHGGLSYDGTNIKFYYNGVPDGTASSTQTFTSFAQQIYGGSEVAPASSLLIYVYVWNRILTDGEFKLLNTDPFYPFSKKLWGFKLPSPTSSINESLSDTLSLSDAILTNVQPALAFFETLSLSDSVTLPGVLNISVGTGDTFVFNDANSQVIQLLGVLTAVLSDQISLNDAESNAIPIGLTIKDNRAKLSLSDSVLKSMKLLTQLNDTLTLTDLVQDVLMPIANLQPSDTFTFSDAVATNLASIFSPINLLFTDQLAINDLNLILKSPDYLKVVDVLNLQDSVIVSLITDLNPYIRRYLNDVLSISNPTPSSSGGSPSGSGGSGGIGGVLFYDDVIPSGLVDGNNTNFLLPNPPNPPSSLELFLSGVLQIPGTDYTLVGSTIVFTTAPRPLSTIVTFYRG